MLGKSRIVKGTCIGLARGTGVLSVRRICLLTALTLAFVVLSPAVTSARASASATPRLVCEPGGIFLRIATPPILRSTNQIVGTNWSGYVAATSLSVPTSGSVTMVRGSWIVPTVTVTATDAYSSDWVGIDGWTSGSVEQIGAEQDSVGGGTGYFAWWEMYPAYPVYITSMTVSPGDRMTAEVSWISGDTFQMTLTDVTKGQSFSAAEPLGQTAARVSAEWIHEAPSWSVGVLPLARTSPVDFTTCQATINGTTGPIDSPSWRSASMYMVSTLDNSVVLSKPTLATSGTDMVVQKPPPWNSTLSIGASPSSVRLPTPFVLSGLLTPGDPDPSDLILVQVMKPGSGRWSYSSVRQVYSENALTGSGPWWYRYTPTLRGTYKFRASFAGETGQTPAASRTISVVVR